MKNENTTTETEPVSHSFVDCKGDEWTVFLDTTLIKQIRKQLHIDLLDLDNGKLIAKIMSDPIMLVDLLYLVCIEDATKRGISDEDFGRRMAGNSIADATEAMLGALVSFIPNARDRKNMRQVLAKTQEVMELTRDDVDKQIAGGVLDRLAEKVRGEQSTSLQA